LPIALNVVSLSMLVVAWIRPGAGRVP